MRSYAEKDLYLWGRVPEMISKASTDLELAIAFEAQARELGQQGVLRLRGFNQEMAFACVAAGEPAAMISSYDVPISGAGLNSAFPFGAAGATLESGRSVTIDFGSCYAAYILDHTRTFAIDYLPDQAWQAFDAASAIQQEMILLAKPGVCCGELFERARADSPKGRTH